MRGLRDFLFGCMACAMLAPQSVRAAEGSLQVLPDSTPLATNAEIARRMMGPQAPRLPGQPIDPSAEHFFVAVPSAMPAGGYGLLVFIPPGRIARVPDEWGGTLEAAGMIFVEAVNSGNDADVFGRRVPLALIAEQNLVKRYRIDPTRIFIGGFSGGSRVALRLALAYPDLFKGALLDAGADPIDTSEMPLPPDDLFPQFRSSRLVYIVGENDGIGLIKDAASMRSMRAHCVLNIEEHVLHDTGHGAAYGSDFADALRALMVPVVPSATTFCPP